ncbi:MAG TPA: hypothetical protein VHU40_08535 [Polyangia bacterium]|nr:hypothetical protein [Polyangia bacterium]
MARLLGWGATFWVATTPAWGAPPRAGSSVTGEPSAGSARPAIPEGPALPPSPEQEARLGQLTERLTAAEARAQTAADNAERALAEEKTRSDLLSQRVSTLEGQVAATAETVKRGEKAPPAVSTVRAGLSLSGFLQADLAWRQSAQDQLNTAGAPLNEDRFLIRRARLRASLERGYVAGAVEFDGNTVRGATARILGAEASLRYPAIAPGQVPLIQATVGSFKIPFGYEVLQSDRDRLFLERSTAERALFPGEYDLGARLSGGWRFLRYALALMNGEPVGETSAFPGRDPNHQKDVVGRVGVDVTVGAPFAIAAGLSGLSGYGFHPGAPATKPAIIWQDRNQDGLFQSNEVSAVAGVSASPSAKFTRQALSGDLRLALRVLPLGETVGYGEFYLAKNLDRAIVPADPRASGRDITELGSYLAITQQLGAHAMVGFRYDYYNPDRDSTDTQVAVLIPQSFIFQTFAFTAALTSESGRLIVEYDVNRNHLGRDAMGFPTNLKDNAFFMRGEAKF